MGVYQLHRADDPGSLQKQRMGVGGAALVDLDSAWPCHRRHDVVEAEPGQRDP